MRKLILTVALAASTMLAGAQTLTSKNGTPILPEAGDWSIGFDAVPVINTFGGIFHTGGGSGVDYPSNNHMTLVGKLVVDENTAYRAKLGINIGSVTNTASTAGIDSLNTASETKVSTMNIALGAGIQKWRGKGRVRGYYGAEVMVGFGGAADTSNTYLKAITATDVLAVQTNEYNGGSTFGLGLNGFIGVEYFFAPKMSLSAEYTWGLAMTTNGESETETTQVENINGTNTVTTKTTAGSKSSSFNLGVGNTVSPNVVNNSFGSGSIVLSFYF